MPNYDYRVSSKDHKNDPLQAVQFLLETLGLSAVGEKYLKILYEEELVILEVFLSRFSTVAG